MTKIEWCDMTWNPVWGCLQGCKYCYAAKIAMRFAKSITKKELDHLGTTMPGFIFNKIREFKPIFLESNFDRTLPQKPKRIFVNSMSDLAYWELSWHYRVLEKIIKNIQHDFLFLTKTPEIYLKKQFPVNCWLGVTATTEKEVKKATFILKKLKGNLTFLSIEPIQEPINTVLIKHINWLIVGAETGNRKDKIIPVNTWLSDLHQLKFPVFMKNNLRPIWNYRTPLRQEFPLLKGINI